MKQSPSRRLKGGERGAVLVQTLLILPILVLAVFGGYTIWKVAFVRHSLHSGTYQATRYLCLNPVDPPVSEIWAGVVVKIVEREVGNNGLAHGASLRSVIVTFSDDELECGLSFTVETQMDLQIGIPFLDLDEVTLRDRHEGRVEC
jgi:hypothetical protein